VAGGGCRGRRINTSSSPAILSMSSAATFKEPHSPRRKRARTSRLTSARAVRGAMHHRMRSRRAARHVPPRRGRFGTGVAAQVTRRRLPGGRAAAPPRRWNVSRPSSRDVGSNNALSRISPLARSRWARRIPRRRARRWKRPPEPGTGSPVHGRTRSRPRTGHKACSRVTGCFPGISRWFLAWPGPASTVRERPVCLLQVTG
jgi:hypothetical protein